MTIEEDQKDVNQDDEQSAAEKSLGEPEEAIEESKPADDAVDDKEAAAANDEGSPEPEPESEPETVDNQPPTYEELQSEVAALKDQLLRALAEAENIRRRTEREKHDMSKYAITNFARQIVSVADNLMRAIDSVSEEARTANDEFNNLYVGIEMTGRELTTSFEQFGIKEIDATGKKFDHNLHQAMFEIDDPSQPAGLVVQEVQRGYTIYDRLLRPAMVGVSKGGPKLESNGVEKESVEPPVEKAASNTSAAYEKQSEAADQEAESGDGQVDKKL
ncbi:MAG: nucleotide exchange factor GrpE [Rhodospirillaceae bacterium]|nr:nucleotide exchange factor GrpE [Rhodospirillaceae bacterium]